MSATPALLGRVESRACPDTAQPERCCMFPSDQSHLSNMVRCCRPGPANKCTPHSLGRPTSTRCLQSAVRMCCTLKDRPAVVEAVSTLATSWLLRIAKHVVHAPVTEKSFGSDSMRKALRALQEPENLIGACLMSLALPCSAIPVLQCKYIEMDFTTAHIVSNVGQSWMAPFKMAGRRNSIVPGEQRFQCGAACDILPQVQAVCYRASLPVPSNACTGGRLVLCGQPVPHKDTV